MLSDTLREGAHGKIFKILFWIIILSFIFAGVGNYLIPRLNTDPVRVGDLSIKASEWNEQYNYHTRMMQRAYGAEASELLEKSDYVRSLRMSVLESMVDSLALNVTVWNNGIRIGDSQVKDVILNNHAFYEDGKFSNDLYLATVRNMGLSPEYYAEQLRTGLLAGSVSEPVGRALSEPMPYELDTVASLMAQTRTVDLYTLDPAALSPSLSVSAEEVQTYYDSHHNDFMEPAEVTFTYIVLNYKDILAGIKADDQTLEDYYNMHQDEFAVAEQREASHILVKSGSTMADTVAKIQEALKSGEPFAEVAKKYSEDVNTAPSGGYLGTIERSTLAENLGDALFALPEEGAVSEPVYDEFGAHILRVDHIIASYVPDFSQIREKVRELQAQSEAQRIYQERLGTLTEQTFENPDSLDAAAAALGLEVQDSGVVRYGAKDLKWPLGEAELQKAAFAENNRTSALNSYPITLSDNAAAVVNVSSYQESRLIPLEQQQDKARELALKSKSAAEAERILREFAGQASQNPAAELPAHVKARKDLLVERSSKEVEPLFAMKIFAVPSEPLGQWILGENHGMPALAVLRNLAEDLNHDSDYYKKLIRTQLEQYKAEEAQNLLYKSARELNEVDYNDDAIRMVIQQNNEVD